MKVYTVHDYDHWQQKYSLRVAYAGTSKKAALAKIKGGGKVEVWEHGQIIGTFKIVSGGTIYVPLSV